MRRTDRAITAQTDILRIIQECTVCTIALHDTEFLYNVPLNFGAEQTADGIVFYFHGAASGTKISLIEKNGKAGFSMSCVQTLVTGSIPCQYTMLYKSVCGNGTIVKVTEPEEKKHALACMMKHYGVDGDYQYTDKEASSVTMLKLTVNQISGKSNIHD